MRHTVHLFIHSQSHSLIPQLALPSFPQFILWSENEHGPMLSRMLPARAETKMMVWAKLSRGRFSAQWHSRSKFRADWVSGLWRKGNKWSGAWRQGRISSSPAREGPLPVQGLAAPAVCVSSCERPVWEPSMQLEQCWRVLEGSRSLMNSAEDPWRQSLLTASLFLWKESDRWC